MLARDYSAECGGRTARLKGGLQARHGGMAEHEVRMLRPMGDLMAGRRGRLTAVSSSDSIDQGAI
jgi:hypothetical protein